MFTEWLNSLEPPLSTLTAFPLWVAAAAIYVVFRVLNAGNAPRILKVRNDRLMRYGDLSGDGSTATSKTEATYKLFLKKAGFNVLSNPHARKSLLNRDGKTPGILMKVPSDNTKKSTREITPDILVWFNRKRRVVVEIDPFHWHGREGLHKVYEDIDRNVCYAASGWAVVRVRIGFPESWKGYRKLGRYDVVLPPNITYAYQMEDDMKRQLVRAVKAAKVATPGEIKAWKSRLATLQQYKDAHDIQRAPH